MKFFRKTSLILIVCSIISSLSFAEKMELSEAEAAAVSAAVARVQSTDIDPCDFTTEMTIAHRGITKEVVIGDSYEFKNEVFGLWQTKVESDFIKALNSLRKRSGMETAGSPNAFWPNNGLQMKGRLVNETCGDDEATWFFQYGESIEEPDHVSETKESGFEAG